MTKTVRQMQEDVRLVDIVIEILDARVPVSSRNPDIDRIAAGKSRLVLLNKADLADSDSSENSAVPCSSMPENVSIKRSLSA